jgi:hypothetical protein
MSLIARRAAEAAFEIAMTANRAAGGGAGNGMTALFLLGTVSTGSTGSPTGPTNWTPSGMTLTFQVSRTTLILAMLVTPGYMVPGAAPGAHDCIVQLKLDGAVQSGIQNSTGLISQVANNGAIAQYTNVNIAQTFLLQPGSHTLAPNYNVVAADSVSIYNAVLFAFQTLA